MRIILKLLIWVIKFFTVLIGSLLLVGGGLCSAITGFTALSQLFNLHALVSGFLLSALFFIVARLGYQLINWADPDKQKNVEFNQHDKDDKQ